MSENNTSVAVLAEISALESMKQFQSEVSDVKNTLQWINEANRPDIDSGPRVRLTMVKGEYSLLRKKVMNLQTFLLMLEAIKDGEKPKLPEDESAKLQNHPMDDMKAEIMKTRDNIMELSRETSHYYTLYTEKLQLLGQKLEHLESKVNRLKELSSNPRIPSLGDIKSEEEAQEHKKLLQDNLTEVRIQREAGKENTATVRNVISGVEEVMAQVQTVLQALDTQLDVKMDALSERQNKLMARVSWLESAIEHTQALSGIESIVVEGNSLLVHFHTSSSLQDHQGDLTTHTEPGSTLMLTVNFGHMRGKFCLSGAEVDLYDLDIADIVEEAVQRDNLEYLITHVNSRWRQMESLHVELDRLRDSYALDWLHTENRVRVLYGEDGHIVCTLTVEPGYPVSGRVGLEKVDGLPVGKTLQEYQCLSPSSSLTKWLHHLQQSFHGTPCPQ